MRLLWVDAAGIRRLRAVPTSRLATGVGLTFASQWLPAFGDTPPDDPVAAPVGEVRLMPDLVTLRQLPWHPAHAAALVHMVVQPPELLWGCCPRAAAARVVHLAERNHGLSLRVGYETEFVLLRKPAAAPGAGAAAAALGGAGGAAGPAPLPPPVDNSVYCLSGSFDAMASGEWQSGNLVW